MRSPFLSIASLSCALVLVGGSVCAQPAASTVSAERLKRLDTILQKYVDDNSVAGIVALVLQDGKPVYERASGWSDKEAGRKMTTNTVFRIASQSKAFTSVAVLQLVEEGKIGITEPVSHFIQTFAKTTVAVGGNMVPAKRQITIADLLTHTAGISYGTDPLVAPLYAAKGLGPAAGMGWYTADKSEPICDSMERLGTLPFVAQPGESFVYGYNTDILGCVVEKASGMSLADFIRTRITEPLGLKDTEFYLPAADRDRLATVYGDDDRGKIVRSPEGAKGQGHYVEGPRKSYSGGAGMLSTAHDYARFLEAIRRGGALDGVRILGSRTVELMTTNQVGKIRGDNGLGFGFGFQTVDRYGAAGMAGVGSFGWGGAYGSTYDVDPSARLVKVLMIQLLPNRTDIQDKFSNGVYQAIVN